MVEEHCSVCEVREGIARGEQAVAEGRVVSQADAKTRLARWLQ